MRLIMMKKTGVKIIEAVRFSDAGNFRFKLRLFSYRYESA